MARRRHVQEQELPFVALMDTMTNVVGVLTIVLVMIGISLARAASRVISALPPATAEQISAAQAEVDRLRAQEARELARIKDPRKDELPPTALATIDTELARLEKAARDAGVKLQDLGALNRELAKRTEELKQKKAAVDQLLAERDRLKGLLDSTPVRRAPPARNVRIPESRPIPADARIEHVVACKDGVYWVDIEGAKNMFLNEFKSSFIRQAEASRVKRGKDTVVTYDHTKLASYFERRKLSYLQFRMEVTFANWTSSPLVKLTPKAAPSPAAIQAAFRRFRANPKTVALFHVTGDGFENYLAAREECDRIGLPAGWEFAGGPAYSFGVPEIATNRPKEQPKPAPPDEIKRPAQKLD